MAAKKQPQSTAAAKAAAAKAAAQRAAAENIGGTPTGNTGNLNIQGPSSTSTPLAGGAGSLTGGVSGVAAATPGATQATVTPASGLTPSQYQLPANEQGAVLPPIDLPGSSPTIGQVQAGTPKGQTGPTESRIQNLLTAYKDAFGKRKKLGPEDLKVMKGLDSDLDTQIEAYVKGEKSGSAQLDKSGKVQKNLPMTDQLLTGGLLDLFGNKTNPTYKLADIKRKMAQEIAKQLPGMSAEEILSHNPDDVLNIPVTQQMSQELEKQGILLPPGSTLATAAEKIGPGNTLANAAVQGKQNTAQTEFNTLVSQYNNASATGKQQIASKLENAGLIVNPFNVTPDDIKQAYTTLIGKAVAGGNESLNSAEKSIVKDLGSNINLQAAQTSTQAAEIDATAQRLGVQLTQQERNYLIGQASLTSNPATGTLGWSQAQIDQAVAGYFKLPTNAAGQFDPSQLSGDAASLYQGFTKIANQYQIPLSMAGVAQHIQNALTGGIVGINESAGTSTADFAQGTGAADAAFLQYAQQTAESLYPMFAKQIGQGIPTTTLLDPYAQVAASVLGMGQTSGTSNTTSASQADVAAGTLNIDWTNPKWSVALHGGTNADGGPGPMSLDDWRRTLITNPQYGWAKTDDAKNLGAGIADHLLSIFGQPAAQGQ